MREWNLKAGDPLALTLAADARLGPTDYFDDQIWELKLSGGDPSALALQSTYGLRARSMRLFPRFDEGDQSVIDPADFTSEPSVRQFMPNYLRVQCTPFIDLDVELEYWVPQSHAVAGRIRLSNAGPEPRQIRLSWIAQLNSTDGVRMAPAEMQSAPVLVGRSGELAPAVFLTGGPQAVSSPYPALILEVDLPAGASRRFTWCHVALSDPEASFALARQTVTRPWEAEIARLELLNAGQVEVYTGEPDWDAALALSQKMAYQAFVGPTENLPAVSFVLSRQTDQGFSLRGDGSDYNHLWNGQTPLEAYYISSLLLPGGTSLLAGLLRNFIASQEEDGFLDWKPGLGGQRSHMAAMPILASLAWRTYQYCQDVALLEEVFQPLLNFVQSWFTARHDRDGDGIPEWDHPMQAGFEDHPIFSRWHEGALGVDIFSAESPALCALLYCECRALIQMAQVLGRNEPVPGLRSLADHLNTALQASWDPKKSTYLNWDRDSHFSTASQKLGELTGEGDLLIQRDFEHPVRLFVRIRTDSENTAHPLLFVYGQNASGQNRVEHITHEQFRWFLGQGLHTGERVYARLDRIVVQGLGEKDRISIATANYSNPDHTVLLPLWAGVPDEKQARALVKKTIASPRRYWRQFGLPACPQISKKTTARSCRSVHLPWNALIAEGMLSYGYREQAAELLRRILSAIVLNLKQDGAFSRIYDVESGEAAGEHNVVTGLAPVGLFLETLGVRVVSPMKVFLSGLNPFPWSVTVKYRGLTVLRRKDDTVVTFPDGQTITVTDPSPQWISLA